MPKIGDKSRIHESNGRAERSVSELLARWQKRRVVDQADSPLPGEGIVSRRLSTVQPTPVKWLWRNRIPLGKLSIVQGDPDKGKTWGVLDILAHVSTGRPFCDGSRCERAEALFVTAEDGIADTIRPRLDLLGADVSRVHWLDVVRVKKRDAALDLNRHLDLLDKWLTKHPLVRVMALDPLAAFLGDIDSHRNADVRSILGRLAKLAEKHSVAIIGINHLTKAFAKALHRSIGSIAFVAAARAVWQVMNDADDDERRLFLPVKMNLCKTRGLAFRITKTGVQWENAAVNMTADEAEREEDESPRAEAKEWLRAQLKHGPVAAKEIEKKARDDGIALRTLNRIKKELGVVSRQSKGRWSWALPQKAKQAH